MTPTHFCNYYLKAVAATGVNCPPNRPCSYSEKESKLNDTLLHFVEFSNVHNCDRGSSIT